MKYLSKLATTIFLFLAMLSAAEAAEVFPAFSSQNLEGQPVTNSVFADKKLTMINFWGTYCPPCIEEMPDLGELARTMPEGTQLVGIVIDVSAGDADTQSEAKDILTKAKADFLQILPVREMIPYLETLIGVPTTIFVDAQGNIVGEPLVGSRSGEAYRAEIIKVLELVQ